MRYSLEEEEAQRQKLQMEKASLDSKIVAVENDLMKETDTNAKVLPC